jgi:hypothetical protein
MVVWAISNQLVPMNDGGVRTENASLSPCAFRTRNPSRTIGRSERQQGRAQVSFRGRLSMELGSQGALVNFLWPKGVEIGMKGRPFVNGMRKVNCNQVNRLIQHCFSQPSIVSYEDIGVESNDPVVAIKPATCRIFWPGINHGSFCPYLLDSL